MRRPCCRSSVASFAAQLVATFCGIGCLTVLFFAAPARAQSVVQGLEKDIQAIFDRTKDGVVRIKAIVPVTDGDRKEIVAEGLSVGTGFFVDGNGLILTAASVLRGADRALVYWRGNTYEAQALGQDLRTNVALLKLNAKTPSLPQGSPDALKVGSMTFAVGFPMDGPISGEYGFVSDPTFISGSVSDKNAMRMPQFIVTSLIRCSVRVQPGQSGSPLLNARGEVVGIVTYSLDQDGSTFALPITAARKIQKDLVEYHAPRDGWTGLTIAVRGDHLKTQDREIAVQDVYEGYPGHLAGIQPGDILRRIGNREIRSAADVMNATFYLSVDETVNFAVEREGKLMELPLKVVQRPSDKERLALKRVAPPATELR
ncbi:MAG: serine protease [Verrucomicrobiae bacterium]|nr:serine protease [Verrucomicrobiae bacterium]